MPNFNQVTLVGHLTRDPEIRHIPSGTSICSCGIAVTDKFKSGDEWKEDTCFVDITIWGARGERFAEWFSKGSAVLVSGKLKLERWDDRESGQKRSKHSVTVFDFQNCSGKREESRQGEQPRQSEQLFPTPAAADDIPF